MKSELDFFTIHLSQELRDPAFANIPFIKIVIPAVLLSGNPV